MTICTRPSCGADLPAESPEFTTTPCVHHSGSPIFHEGQKSWSCCKDVNKPVLDFDDFVKIKGCTTVVGHSKERPKQVEKTQSSKQEVVGTKMDDGSEVFGSAPPKTKTSTTTAQLPAPTATATSTPTPYIEPTDPESLTTIAQGATCKRPGCGYVHQSTLGPRDRSKESCAYHKGFPIFHEGSKGYSCCKRRVLEFSEFLKIEPCTTASTGHLFTQPPKAPTPLLQTRGLTLQPGEVETECRMDHYETPDEIRMTIYCKGLDISRSTVLLEEDDLLLSLALPPTAQSNMAPRRHLLHLPLHASIQPHPVSTYTVSSSKIKMDITLVKKVKGQSWPTLQRGGTGGGYGLTFGRQ